MRAAEPTDPALGPGRIVGGAEIESLLGSGGVGVVLAARDVKTGRALAVKVLQRVFADDPVLAARFDREAKVMASLTHANIVEIVASGRLDDGRPYLVMPRLPGRTLRDLLRERGGAMPAPEAWSLLRPIALALQTAHAAGIVHRDLKPENVALIGEGESIRPVLLDFGLAKVAPNTSDPKLTATGAPVGTPSYMSPEQWWNHEVDAATDQYALGVMAFEMLTGRLPFVRDTYVAMMQDHLSTPAPTLASARVTATPAMEAFVARALCKQPGERFASMRALIEAGDAAFAGEVARQRDPRRAALVVALAVPLAMPWIGYAGSRDPREWIRIGGFGVWAVLLAWLVGLGALVRGRASAARVAAVLCGVASTFGTFTGWRMVIRTIERRPIGSRFELLGLGMSEANAVRFLGFVLAGSLLMGAMAFDPGRRRTREALAVGVGSVLLAAVCAWADALSAAWVALLAGMVATAMANDDARRSDAVRAGSFGLLALALVVASASARIDAREGIAWTEAPSRATRAAWIVAAAGERPAWMAVSLVAIVAVAALQVLRIRRAPPGPLLRATPGTWLAALIVMVWVASDVALAVAVISRRAALWSELAPQFALFAQLDPPRGENLPAPPVEPTLQLARDVVAIDGTRVGLTRALESPEASAALSVDLSHRLARQGDAQLALLADRGVTWRSLRPALRVAYGVGIRELDVLLTRGAAPQLSPRAPPEASYALPRDFVALRVALLPGTDPENPETRFDSLAARLRAAPMLHVGP